MSPVLYLFTTLLEKNSAFFLRRPVGFQWSAFAWADISWYQKIKEPGKPQESGFSPKNSESCVLLQLFRHFLYNENPTTALNNTSLKWCLPSTDAIDRRMRMEVQGRTHESALHWIPPGFRKKKRSDTFLTEKYARFLQLLVLLILTSCKDINVIGDDNGTIEINADVLLNACKDICLAVNTGKTKYMEIGRTLI